jgi:hypothetical protein
MRYGAAIVVGAFTLVVLIGVALGSETDISAEEDFLKSNGSCGVAFWNLVQPMTVDEPAILDAWTTLYPFSDPDIESYTFQKDADTLAFVVRYLHVGGQIPVQYGRAYLCGESSGSKKDCVFPWTIAAPPGEYLLINYYAECRFNAGVFDWAAKVGDVVFGYPDPSHNRPLWFEIYD